MALIVKDRVREITITEGTGDLLLAGSIAGFQSFSVIGDGNTTYYCVVDPATGAWEVGLGTYSAGTTTLARTTVHASSNAGLIVDFAAGQKDVFCTHPASFSLFAVAGRTGEVTLTSADLTDSTAAGRTLITAADAAAQRTALALNNVTNDAQLKIASNLSDLANVATARSNLGLGTAAEADVTESQTDTTVGRVLKVGDFGFGSVDGYMFGGPTNGGGLSVRTLDNNADYIFQAISSGGAERFTVAHGAPHLKGDGDGWTVNGNEVLTPGSSWFGSMATRDTGTGDGQFRTNAQNDARFLPGAMPPGGIIMWSGSVASIPSGWALCNGSNGTPNLRNRFVIAAGGQYEVGDTGGGTIPSHTHGRGTLSTNSTGSHGHSGTASSAGSHRHTVAINVSSVADRASVYPEFRGVTSSNSNTSSTGAHTHSLSINSNGSHSHTVSGSTAASGSGSEVIAKYYALAYIMKLEY